jgi:hypothetical protein
LAVAGVSCGLIEGFFFRPPLRFAEVNRGEFGEQYPADACGAICLSFRALVKLSRNTGSTNWELIQKKMAAAKFLTF